MGYHKFSQPVTKGCLFVFMFEAGVSAQELSSFKKFSDSLLSKSSKMHNLLSELEDYIPDMSEGADKKKSPEAAQQANEPQTSVAL